MNQDNVESLFIYKHQNYISTDFTVYIKFLGYLFDHYNLFCPFYHKFLTVENVMFVSSQFLFCSVFILRYVF